MADIIAPYTVEEFTASDGCHWRYRRYESLPTPARNVRKGTGDSPSLASQACEVVCIHGIQSHAGWYEYSCCRLAQAGYAVSFLDRRGSGINQENRGDIPGFRRIIDDIAEYVQFRRQTAKCVFLLAISWGGKLAVAMQRRRPDLVDGLILLCPGFFAKVRPPFFQRLAIFFSRLFRPRRLFPVPLNDPELFTENPKWLEFLRNDPLALRQATARLLIESVRLDMYLRWCPNRVHVPVLLLLAGRDRIIHNERTRRFVERFAATDRTIIEYPDAHHTLEFEQQPDRFIDDVLTWLNSHQRTE